jgi:hypothetical protein
VSALGLPPTAGEWLEQRGRELDWRLKKFARSLKRDALEGVRYRDGRLQISPFARSQRPTPKPWPTAGLHFAALPDKRQTELVDLITTRSTNDKRDIATCCRPKPSEITANGTSAHDQDSQHLSP